MKIVITIMAIVQFITWWSLGLMREQILTHQIALEYIAEILDKIGG